MDHDQPKPQPPADTLQWRVWPAGRRPALSIAVGAFGLVLSAIAIWSFRSSWYGFITLIVLAATLAPHFFPSTYALDGEKVVARGGGGNVERRWEAFRVAVELEDRIILSPFTDTSRWLARRRSISLRLADNRDEVRAFVARHVPVK